MRVITDCLFLRSYSCIINTTIVNHLVHHHCSGPLGWSTMTHLNKDDLKGWQNVCTTGARGRDGRICGRQQHWKEDDSKRDRSSAIYLWLVANKQAWLSRANISDFLALSALAIGASWSPHLNQICLSVRKLQRRQNGTASDYFSSSSDCLHITGMKGKGWTNICIPCVP